MKTISTHRAMSAFLALALLLAAAAVTAQANRIPAETRVAIVPIVNDSPEPSLEFKQEQAEFGVAHLTNRFQERGFQIVPASEIAAAIQEAQLDFSDRENWTRRNLYLIGQKTGADLVVFAVITDSQQRTEQRLFISQKVGTASMMVWLLEPKEQRAILSGQTVAGQSRSDAPGAASGQELRKRAVRIAFDNLLVKRGGFLANFPIVNR
jgi:hypothetical protein